MINKLALIAALWVPVIAIAQAPIEPGLEIKNASSQAIQHVLAKPNSSPKWGSPLANSAVPAGKTRDLQVVRESNCVFDVRLVFAGGKTEDHPKVDVCKRAVIETH